MLPNKDVIAKETLSLQLIFKTLSVGPARARALDGTHPTELTRRRLARGSAFNVLQCYIVAYWNMISMLALYSISMLYILTYSVLSNVLICDCFSFVTPNYIVERTEGIIFAVMTQFKQLRC